MPRNLIAPGKAGQVFLEQQLVLCNYLKAQHTFEFREAFMQNAYFCYDDYLLSDERQFRDAVLALKVGFVGKEEAKDPQLRAEKLEQAGAFLEYVAGAFKNSFGKVSLKRAISAFGPYAEAAEQAANPSPQKRRKSVRMQSESIPKKRKLHF